MAQRTIVTMTDDLDGSVATETILFGLDGASYEIDLAAEHAADLREVLGQFIAHARTASGTGSLRRRRQAASPTASTPTEVDTKAVRTWPPSTASRSTLAAGSELTSSSSTGARPPDPRTRTVTPAGQARPPQLDCLGQLLSATIVWAQPKYLLLPRSATVLVLNAFYPDFRSWWAHAGALARKGPGRRLATARNPQFL